MTLCAGGRYHGLFSRTDVMHRTVIDKYRVIADSGYASGTERIGYIQSREPLGERLRVGEGLRRIYKLVIQIPTEPQEGD